MVKKSQTVEDYSFYCNVSPSSLSSNTKEAEDNGMDRFHIDPATVKKWYTEDPVLFGGVTRLADFVCAVGYEIKKDDNDEVKDFFDKMSLPFFLRNSTINLTMDDAVFWNLKEGFPKVVASEGMKVLYDDFGIVKGYKLKLPKATKSITYDADSIVMIKMNSLGNGIVGTSPIIPLRTYLEAKSKVETFTAEFFNRNGVPRLQFIVKEKSKEKRVKIKEAIKTMKPFEDMITDDMVEVKPISQPISDMMFENWLEYLNSVIRMGIGIPDIIAGFSKDSNKANSRIQYQGFKFRIRAIHTLFAHYINTQVIPFYFPNSKAYIVFKDLDMEDANLSAENRQKVAYALSSYTKAGILDPETAKVYALDDLDNLTGDLNIKVKGRVKDDSIPQDNSNK